MMGDDIRKMSKDIQDRIRDLAYVMWESAGRQQGMAMEYWLAAEKEIVTTAQAATEKMVAAGKAAKPKKAEAAPTAGASAATKAAGKTATRKKTTS